MSQRSQVHPDLVGASGLQPAFQTRDTPEALEHTDGFGSTHGGGAKPLWGETVTGLGDPHEDLGWASLPMYMGGSKLICRLAEPDWFYTRYAEKVGFDVSMDSVRYYQALSLLKLAATHMAAARCFEEGRFNDMRMPAMGSQIATCLRQMEKTIEAGA